jgi:hypothetical protein
VIIRRLKGPVAYGLAMTGPLFWCMWKRHFRKQAKSPPHPACSVALLLRIRYLTPW